MMTSYRTWLLSAIGLTNYLYYQSVSYISASLAIVILMQFTWFSLFLEWIIFAKKPSRLELLTVFFIPFRLPGEVCLRKNVDTFLYLLF